MDSENIFHMSQLLLRHQDMLYGELLVLRRHKIQDNFEHRQCLTDSTALLDELLGWLTPQTKLAFSILAVGAMLVGIQLANVQSKTQLELSRYMQQFSEQEIQKYLAENIDDIDEVSLIKNTELKTANELFLNSDIQLKSVEEYWLQENDIDYTELDSDLI